MSTKLTADVMIKSTLLDLKSVLVLPVLDTLSVLRVQRQSVSMCTNALVFAEDASAHAALVSRPQSPVLKLQLIITGRVNKRTPAENTLESSPESVTQTLFSYILDYTI